LPSLYEAPEQSALCDGALVTAQFDSFIVELYLNQLFDSRYGTFPGHLNPMAALGRLQRRESSHHLQLQILILNHGYFALHKAKLFGLWAESTYRPGELARCLHSRKLSGLEAPRLRPTFAM